MYVMYKYRLLCICKTTMDLCLINCHDIRMIVISKQSRSSFLLILLTDINILTNTNNASPKFWAVEFVCAVPTIVFVCHLIF